MLKNENDNNIIKMSISMPNLVYSLVIHISSKYKIVENKLTMKHTLKPEFDEDEGEIIYYINIANIDLLCRFNRFEMVYIDDEYSLSALYEKNIRLNTIDIKYCGRINNPDILLMLLSMLKKKKYRTLDSDCYFKTFVDNNIYNRLYYYSKFCPYLSKDEIDRVITTN